jgi:hypothetical protein
VGIAGMQAILQVVQVRLIGELKKPIFNLLIR